MVTTGKKKVHKFLQKGGEMGQLINDKDWSHHSLGNPQDWQIALKVTLSNILKTSFPKFVFWGSELICFYNDAYRPSLGKEGKHPSIIGARAEEAWPEIWDTIKPMIDQVLATGKPIWSENQLIPIYRNGRIENVYWTFSYSALLGDDENISGILVTCAETTEAVINLRRLEESEDQLKFAINAAELSTWDYDPKTDKFVGNDRLKNWFGLPKDIAIALPKAVEVIVPKDRQRVSNAIRKALEGKNKGKYDITYSIANLDTKEQKIVHALGRAWFGEDGQAYRFNGTLQDVTQRARSAEELRVANALVRKEEKRFRNIVHKAPVGIAIFKGNELKVEMANLSLLQIVDRKSEVFVGKKLFEAIPEVQQVAAHLFDKVHRLKESVKGTALKVPIMRKGRLQEAYFDFILHPIQIENGKVLEIMMVANEVTDYIVARNILAENENQFRNLVLQSPIAMAIFRGDDLRIEMANQRLLDHFWKRTWDDVIGERLVDIFPEQQEQAYVTELKEVIRTGRAVPNHEPRALIFNGDEKREFYVDYDYSPLTELDGSVSGVMITMTDVTDQFLAKKKLVNFSKELEKQVKNRTELLRKANDNLHLSVKKLENANAELESFAYVSSHDLQEPLRKIQMYTSRILEQEHDQLSEKGKKYFDKITVSAHRMRTLIDDLLAFSRTEEYEAEFKSTDLNNILKEVLENLSGKINETSAKVKSSKLPTIRAVPFQMRQVFNNIIGNAIKFSKENLPPKIAITSESVKGKETKGLGLNPRKVYHKITIKDNGIGFAGGMNDQIFEVFKRLHVRGEYEGTGIGLSIVKKIVVNHNGAITAAGTEGEGAMFTIYLP